MKSIASLLLLLLLLAVLSASAAEVDDDLVATFVGVVDFRRPEPPVASSVGGGFNHEGDIGSHKLQPSTADGSKGTHYGDPAEGCMKDEHPFQIQGVDGMICAPKCTAFRPCPSDLPKGVTAAPQCALKSPDGNTYCALICSPDLSDEDNDIDIDLDDDFMLRGAGSAAASANGGGECGAASCQAIGGAGICTYSE